MKKILTIFLLLFSARLCHATACPTGYSNIYKVSVAAVSSISSNLSSFPVLFEGNSALSAAGSGGYSQSNGVDVVFCTGSGTILPYELVSGTYSSTTGAGEWWVQYPTVSYNTTETIYAMVGQSSASDMSCGSSGTNNCGSTLWANYKLVTHGGSLLNSVTQTSMTNHGSTTSAIGPFGNSNTFNGSSYIDTGISAASLGTTLPITAQAWFDFTSSSGSPAFGMIGNLTGTGPYNGWAGPQIYAGNVLRCFIYNSSGQTYRASTATFGLGTWALANCVMAGNTTMTLYGNGSAAGSGAAGNNATGFGSSSQNVYIGVDYVSGGEYFKGSLAEVRLSTLSLSADWIKAEYLNQSAPTSFYSIAAFSPATPTFSPCGASNCGAYLTTQTVTLSAGGMAIIYTTDGSTPTVNSSCSPTNGSSYSSALTVSSSETIEALSCFQGLTSSVATGVYYINPSDSQVASNDFSAYFNPNLHYGSTGNNYASVPYQLPLDTVFTGASWQNSTNQAGFGGSAVAAPDAIRGSICGGGSSQCYEAVLAAASSKGASTTAPVPVVDVANGYYAGGQYSKAQLHLSGGYAEAGVVTNCTTNGTLNCYGLQLVGTSIYLWKWVAGTYTTIASGSAGSYSDGATLELRSFQGGVLQPLLNGAAISGLSTCNPSCVDATALTGGQPGIEFSGNGATAVYGWSAGNLGGASSGYTPPTITYTTYTDAMNTSGYSPALPWYQNTYSTDWIGTFSGEAIAGGGYGAGPNYASSYAGTQYIYRNAFKVSQWSAWTVAINPWDPRLFNYFGELDAQSWIPGLDNGGCTAAGTTATCFDFLSYYGGMELEWGFQGSARTTECSGKAEYACTPFFHSTKVTPQASPGNQVRTVAGSMYTTLQGDAVELRYVGGYVQGWCKQGSSPVAWASLHTYSSGNWIKDPSGGVQLVITGGVSGATIPTFGETWSGNNGATTTDATVTWEYMGDICPTTATYTLMFSAADSDLSNPSITPSGYTAPLGTGFPGIFAQTAPTSGSAAAFPAFTGYSNGSVGYGSGEPCAMSGQCVISGGIITGGIF